LEIFKRCLARVLGNRLCCGSVIRFLYKTFFLFEGRKVSKFGLREIPPGKNGTYNRKEILEGRTSEVVDL